MATKLRLFNDALLHLGERKLSALTENREPRRALDDAYESAVNYCLEQGFWKFAVRTAKLTPSQSLTPAFGYDNAFEKPTDNVRLYKICSDDLLQSPILDFSEEGAFWMAHDSIIYVAYVSNAANYGADLSLWPETFSKYVALYLSCAVRERVAPAVNQDRLENDRDKALSNAQAKDAMKGPTAFPPPGSWRGIRNGRSRRERGNRGSLIG